MIFSLPFVFLGNTICTSFRYTDDAHDIEAKHHKDIDSLRRRYDDEQSDLEKLINDVNREKNRLLQQLKLIKSQTITSTAQADSVSERVLLITGATSQLSEETETLEDELKRVSDEYVETDR